MPSPSGIILKASDFKVQGRNVYINKNKINNNIGLLLIHATWCGHCKQFMSTFNEINADIGSKFACASIESEQLKGQNILTSALNFQGYPTICFFDKDGLIIGQYNGNRDKRSMLDMICKVYHRCVTK